MVTYNKTEQNIYPQIPSIWPDIEGASHSASFLCFRSGSSGADVPPTQGTKPEVNPGSALRAGKDEVKKSKNRNCADKKKKRIGCKR